MSRILSELAFESRTDHLWSTPAIMMTEELANITTIDGPLKWAPRKGIIETMRKFLSTALEELTAENPNTVRTRYLEPLEKAMRDTGTIPQKAPKSRVEQCLRAYLALTEKIAQCELYSTGGFDEEDHFTAINLRRILERLHEVGEGTKYDRMMRRSHKHLDLHD